MKLGTGADLEAGWMMSLYASQCIREGNEGVNGVNGCLFLLVLCPLILAAALIVPFTLNVHG